MGLSDAVRMSEILPVAANRLAQALQTSCELQCHRSSSHLLCRHTGRGF
jgi:hypothetical protein